MLTPEQISACTGSSLEHANVYAIALWEAMDAYDINTPARQAAFLAQIGHESGGLRYVREIWGPTAAQAGYEGRADLGNIYPGDGKRYAGHGLIQITGRSNHARATLRLKNRFPDMDVPDFEEDPSALMLPQWAALSAAEYWHRTGCNQLADAGSFVAITRKINGGTNGLDDRMHRYACAQSALDCA